jgi:hypothetical protein
VRAAVVAGPARKVTRSGLAAGGEGSVGAVANR